MKITKQSIIGTTTGVLLLAAGTVAINESKDPEIVAPTYYVEELQIKDKDEAEKKIKTLAKKKDFLTQDLQEFKILCAKEKNQDCKDKKKEVMSKLRSSIKTGESISRSELGILSIDTDETITIEAKDGKTMEEITLEALDNF